MGNVRYRVHFPVDDTECDLFVNEMRPQSAAIELPLSRTQGAKRGGKRGVKRKSPEQPPKVAGRQEPKRRRAEYETERRRMRAAWDGRPLGPEDLELEQRPEDLQLPVDERPRQQYKRAVAEHDARIREFEKVKDWVKDAVEKHDYPDRRDIQSRARPAYPEDPLCQQLAEQFIMRATHRPCRRLAHEQSAKPNSFWHFEWFVLLLLRASWRYQCLADYVSLNTDWMPPQYVE